MDMFLVIIIVEVISAFWYLGSRDAKHLTMHRAVLISKTCPHQMSIVPSVTKIEVESIYFKNYVSVLHGIYWRPYEFWENTRFTFLPHLTPFFFCCYTILSVAWVYNIYILFWNHNWNSCLVLFYFKWFSTQYQSYSCCGFSISMLFTLIHLLGCLNFCHIVVF